MVSSLDVFSLVTDYVERRISINELENLVTQMLPVYMSVPDSEMAKLAGTVELALAEIFAGIRSERNLRRFFSSHYQQIHNQFYSQQDAVEDLTSAGTRASFEDLVWQSQPQVVYSEPQVEYA